MDDDTGKISKALAVVTAAILSAIFFILLIWGLHSVWTGFTHSLG